MLGDYFRYPKTGGLCTSNQSSRDWENILRVELYVNNIK